MTDWTLEAACAETGDVGFFPPYWDENVSKSDRIMEARAAVAVCRGCGVREECLSYALENPEVEGIWGGLRRSQRTRLLQVRRAS